MLCQCRSVIAAIVKILDNDEALPHGNKVNAKNGNLINGKSNIFITVSTIVLQMSITTGLKV